jgi:ElaA protein
MTSLPVIQKTWGEFTPDDVFEMAVLRSEVFFLEQKIDEKEFDHLDRDPSTLHLWVADERGMAAYLRIVHQPDAAESHEGIPDSLGRMVVRADARGRGLAQALMARALEVAGHQPLYLHGQEYVAGLYEKFGFQRRGEVFSEAGIPHILMVRMPDA